MSQSDAELTVAQRLGQLLDRGLLPAGGPAEAAERLIERLERPARVALLGLPGAGKSAILNLLTGAVVVPETLRLPTIIVQHGAEARMLCTLTDGRTQAVPGSDLNAVLPLNPALVTLEMDLPALKVISLLEVSAGPMEAEQRRAAIWAGKRADILIWCTTSYLPKEQQVWEGMPDVVKDNGFLFLTKVDLLGSREAADGMLERVENRAGEEFRQVLSISARQARSAMPPGEPVDRDLFRDSGAAAVITTIKSRVQAARRADTDMAELLLARHVEASEIVARRFADLDSEPAPAGSAWTPPPEPPAELTLRAVEETPEPPDVPAPPETGAQHPGADEVPALPDAEPEADVPLEWRAAASSPSEPASPAEPERAPEPVVAPPARSTKAERQVPEQPVEGRRRFSDRIRQMPVPDDAPAVPLRSTWKSKTETATPRPPVAEPDPAPAEAPRPAPSGESRSPRPGARSQTADANRTDPEADDATLERMLASVAAPPDATDDAAVPVTMPDLPADDEAEEPDEEEDTTPDAALPEADDSPRWAERLRPADPVEAGERSPRTSLFGSRKPAVTPGGPAAVSPAGRVARPTEPVTRVRAPAPRPAEPPRPETPSAEALATPRIVATRDRPPADPGDPVRTERRPRIARVVPADSSAPAAPVALPTAEKGLLDGAVQHIGRRSAELAATVDPDEKIPVDEVLDHARETIEQLIDLLGAGRSPGLRRIVADLGEIQDIVVLMKLEKGHAPADDALTLLLQIRRDLETLNAA